MKQKSCVKQLCPAFSTPADLACDLFLSGEAIVQCKKESGDIETEHCWMMWLEESDVMRVDSTAKV